MKINWGSFICLGVVGSLFGYVIGDLVIAFVGGLAIGFVWTMVWPVFE
jgi:hypothetical protein